MKPCFLTAWFLMCRVLSSIELHIISLQYAYFLLICIIQGNISCETVFVWFDAKKFKTRENERTRSFSFIQILATFSFITRSWITCTFKFRSPKNVLQLGSSLGLLLMVNVMDFHNCKRRNLPIFQNIDNENLIVCCLRFSIKVIKTENRVY